MPAGRPTKHPRARTGHREREELIRLDDELTGAGDVEPWEVPEPPEWADLSGAGREAWDCIWSDPVTRHWGLGPARTLMAQYCMYFDRWLELMHSFRAQKFVHGSTGQPALSPALRGLAEVRAAMEAIERSHWIDPQSALRAGIERVHGLHALKKLQQTNDEPPEAEWAPPDGYVVTVEPVRVPSEPEAAGAMDEPDDE